MLNMKNKNGEAEEEKSVTMEKKRNANLDPRFLNFHSSKVTDSFASC